MTASITVAVPPPEKAPETAPGSGGRRLGRRARRVALRWGPGAAETGLAVGATVLFSLWAADIGRNPLLRVNQVSALASIELRFSLLARAGGWSCACRPPWSRD